MAITHDYVSWSTGNDYKGASFTDGAYTSATKTLIKNGAFAATKVNHWLYLESNDGGSIVAGYYRVATVSDANTVILATDAGAGVDDDAAKCTQHDGTTALPWRSDQGACDLLTRNTTDGNQVNILAGAAVVHAAALNLATFIAGGALNGTAPLIIRGCTSAANDGGIGEIDCNGATMFTETSYDFVVLVDLELHTFGGNNGVVLDAYAVVINCEIHKGASAPSGKYLLTVNATSSVSRCYLHDLGTNGRAIMGSGTSLIYGNYIIVESGAALGILVNANPGTTTVARNIIRIDATGGHGVYNNASGVLWLFDNIVFSTVDNTTSAYQARGYRYHHFCMNNIIGGFSGIGGEAIEIAADTGLVITGHNAFYDNTADYTLSDAIHVDLTANDVALAADPFTDAANGDFSLTDAAKTALAAKGFPTAYLGAHANTVSNLNIGPIQLTASSGGGRPAFGDRSGGKF